MFYRGGAKKVSGGANIQLLLNCVHGRPQGRQLDFEEGTLPRKILRSPVSSAVHPAGTLHLDSTWTSLRSRAAAGASTAVPVRDTPIPLRIFSDRAGGRFRVNRVIRETCVDFKFQKHPERKTRWRPDRTRPNWFRINRCGGVGGKKTRNKKKNTPSTRVAGRRTAPAKNDGSSGRARCTRVRGAPRRQHVWPAVGDRVRPPSPSPPPPRGGRQSKNERTRAHAAGHPVGRSETRTWPGKKFPGAR